MTRVPVGALRLRTATLKFEGVADAECVGDSSSAVALSVDTVCVELDLADVRELKRIVQLAERYLVQQEERALLARNMAFDW